MVGVGFADQHRAGGGGAERAVPQASHLCDLHGVGAAVAGHGGGAPGEGGGQFGQPGQPPALLGGPAAAAGARRRRGEHGGVGRQPGGDRGPRRQQRPCRGRRRPRRRAQSVAGRLGPEWKSVLLPAAPGTRCPCRPRAETESAGTPDGCRTATAPRSRRSPTGCRGPVWPVLGRRRRGSNTRGAPSCPSGEKGCHPPRR